MIKFEKVSFKQFNKSVRDIFGFAIPDDDVKEIYDNIKLPQRGTKGSAGYDFFAPVDISFFPNSYQVIPTGIRFVTDVDGIFLGLFPRSGLGFKYQSHLANVVGICDSDYQYSDNEGHIMIKMTGEKPFEVEAGKAFCQGIILPYFVIDGDNVNNVRNGGFGSTGV